MSRDLLARIARRALVLAMTGAVIGVGAFTVQLASEWRAAEAPLDTSPVSLSAISDQYAIESERAAALETEIGGVATQVSDLRAALIAATDSLDGDADSAEMLRDQLAAAKDKLTSMQKQLKAAQGRLDALNRAAARQAALNRQAATTRSGGGGSGGEGDDDDEHDDD